MATELATMIPSASSLVSTYASLSTTLMLFRNAYKETVPLKVHAFIVSKLKMLFSNHKLPLISCYATLIVDNSWDGLSHNILLDAAIYYVSTKISASNRIIRVGMFEYENDVQLALTKGDKVVDVFDGIEVTWSFNDPKENEDGNGNEEAQLDSNEDEYDDFFELTFEEKYKERVLNEYLVHVVETYEAAQRKERVLKLHSRREGYWSPKDLVHPSTFETLAMDYEMKKKILDDLDLFLSRRDFYKRVGKAWKRGYLLYGPPGTGKSSLIAAMANYLKFHIYDVELSSFVSDNDLRDALLHTDNKSIIVIEDIDCNKTVHTRSKSSSQKKNLDPTFTLSALINSIDGLWSSCSEERIFIFTTNRKEVLDPALLRPGRMDMHIHMSYCTKEAFRTLALNYLDIKEHQLFDKIDSLIQNAEVTPASIAEVLLRNYDNADAALGEVISLLKEKNMEKDQTCAAA